MREGEENRSEVTSDGIAFSAEGKCTEFGTCERGKVGCFSSFLVSRMRIEVRCKGIGEEKQTNVFSPLMRN